MKIINLKLFIAVLIIGCSTAKIDYNLPQNGITRVYTGLEVFMEKHAFKYRGRNAAVVTNHSGIDFHLNQNVMLFKEKGINVYLILAPEHGVYGYESDYEKNMFTADRTLNTFVFNMHMLNRDVLNNILKWADVVIFDIQDMGMRCYTYISNLKFIMDSLNGTGRELIVLDRPVPIGFLGVDGPFLDKRFTSRFISAFPAPFIYNMTMGEAARYYQGEFAPEVKLTVIEMKNYRRGLLFTDTSLPWVPPSPNLPTYYSSIIYTAVVLMEGINISIGRGTTKPFEYIGAPWIEPYAFCRGLESLGLKNFRFKPVYFVPTFNKYAGRKCGGAQIFYVGGTFSPTMVSYRITRYIFKNYFGLAAWTFYGNIFDIDYLAGTDGYRKAVNAGINYEEFEKETADGVREFRIKRKKYLLY